VPALDKLIFRAAGDKDALITAYKAGDYDHVEDFTIGDFPKFAGIPSNEVLSSAQFFYEHLEFNQRPQAPNAKANGGKSIFADQNVRKAFFESFDRCTAITTILGKDCNDPAVRTNVLTVPLDPAWDANAVFPAYNGAQGLSDMEAAGFKLNGGKLDYPGTTTQVSINVSSTVGNALRNAFMQRMTADWATNLHIKATFAGDPKIFSSFADGGLLYTGNFDVALFAFQTTGDIDQLTSNFQSDQIPSATLQTPENYQGVQNPQIDALLKQQRGELNVTTRIGEGKQIYDLIASNYYSEPLYIRPNISLTKTTLINYFPHPTQAGNEWNIGDWGQGAKATVR
jgi:ABC-type transport system substrate-binding protein